ncbi:hypothetical protein HK096_000730 [Nowakowskiella sp. JEL0078]|nr:hypothetical protein HK096_000730 [Nowakowskiella sp. JEL0078]
MMQKSSNSPKPSSKLVSGSPKLTLKNISSSLSKRNPSGNFKSAFSNDDDLLTSISPNMDLAKISNYDRDSTEIRREYDNSLALTVQRLQDALMERDQDVALAANVGESLLQTIDTLRARIAELENNFSNKVPHSESISQLQSIESDIASLTYDLREVVGKIKSPSLSSRPGSPETTTSATAVHTNHSGDPNSNPTTPNAISKPIQSESKLSGTPTQARNRVPRIDKPKPMLEKLVIEKPNKGGVDAELAAAIDEGVIAQARVLQHNLSVVQTENAELIDSIIKLEKKVEIIPEQSEIKIYNFEVQLTEKNENVILMESQLHRAHVEIESLKIQCRKLSKEIETLKSNEQLEIEKVRHQNDATITSLRKDLTMAQREIRSLQHQLEDLNEEENDLTHNISRRNASIDEGFSFREASFMTMELQSANASLEHARDQITDIKETCYRLEAEKLELRQMLSEAQENIEKLMNLVDERHLASGFITLDRRSDASSSRDDRSSLGYPRKQTLNKELNGLFAEAASDTTSSVNLSPFMMSPTLLDTPMYLQSTNPTGFIPCLSPIVASPDSEKIHIRVPSPKLSPILDSITSDITHNASTSSSGFSKDFDQICKVSPRKAPQITISSETEALFNHIPDETKIHDETINDFSSVIEGISDVEDELEHLNPDFSTETQMISSKTMKPSTSELSEPMTYVTVTGLPPRSTKNTQIIRTNETQKRNAQHPVQLLTDLSMISTDTGDEEKTISLKVRISRRTEMDNSIVIPSLPMQALGSTMIGGWFQKYNRFGKHPQMRFVWVNPYSQTLLWAPNPPSQQKTRNVKTAYIESVHCPPAPDTKNLPPSTENYIMITTPDRFIKLVPLNWSDHAMWCEGLTLLVNRASSKTPVYEQFRLVDATPVSAADTNISFVSSPAPPEAICAPPSAGSETPTTQIPTMRRRATVTAPLSSFFRRSRAPSIPRGGGTTSSSASRDTSASRVSSKLGRSPSGSGFVLSLTTQPGHLKEGERSLRKSQSAGFLRSAFEGRAEKDKRGKDRDRS